MIHFFNSMVGTLRKARWAAGLAVAALLLTAPGCRISSPSVSLAAGKTTITLGDSTTLTAVFPGKPGSATIDNGVGDVTSGVPVTVSPTEDTTYTLTFRPVAKAFTASVTVHVVANPTTPSITVAPRISGGARNLTASVAPQAGCTFLWTITGGSITAGGTTDQVTFSAGTSGSLVLTCAAVNAAGSASQPATATATIIPVAGTPTITAPGFVTAGQPGYQASVPVVAGDSYAWTLTGGTVTDGLGTDTITFTPGASGSVQLGCVITNLLGTPGPGGIAFCSIVAPPDLPVITAPASVLAGATGQTASVAAQPGTTYAWTLANGAITDGDGTNSITFTAGLVGSLQLTCVVTNAAGTPSSSVPVTVPVLAAPVILAQPAGVTVSAPTAATFSVVATGNPAPAYQWYLNAAAIPGANAASYTIPATTFAMDGGSYTVAVSNALGSVTSSAAILTVNAGPAITAQPAGITVTAGAAATFSVTATGTAPITYQWNLNGVSLGATARAASYTTPVTTLAMNLNSYTVTVTNPLGSVTSSPAILTVDAAPAITAQPVSLTVGAGATATFSVTATGNPAVAYQWNLNGVSLGAGATSASYTTPVTTLAMNLDSYTVTVSNTLGSVTSSAAVLTVNAGPAITVQPVGITVTAGATATFSVTATGNPAVTYQWNLGGVSLGAAARTASYTTAATTLAMNGNSYTVTVTNTLGSVTSAAAVLTVDAGPAITVQPVGVAVTAGATATFSVVATGNPAVAYQWNLNGVSLGATARASSYTTAATTLGMNGDSYTVTVSNTLNSVTSSAAILTVDQAPAITVQPSNDTVVNGSPATFSVTAIGNPLTYQWDVGGTAPAPGPVGTNSATYTIPATDLTMDGYTFTVTVTNTLGTVVSNTVTLNVTAAAIVSVSLSDASTEDWATIGVKVLRIALVPKGSGSPVPVYTAPVPVPVTNLVQLDNLSELLADASVPPGTYAGAVLTLAANPGDVALVTSADPSTGFKAPAATAIPPGQIRIQGATGTPGNLTVPVTVPLAADLVVAAGQRAALDLEFDLSHPAFILDHRAAGEPAPIWAVNFNGPVRHHPAAAARLVLRHLYGTVTGASADQAALKVTKVNPAWPGTSPETAQPTLQSLEIRADSANGTLFHDLDARTSSTILDFSSVSGALAGKYLRVAARRQADGTLVAARIWAGSSFGAVYSGPEGHVLHVDAGAGILTVAGPAGTAVPIQITPATRFFFRTPADAQADAKAIGTGPGFLGAHVVRGFKVHAAIDPAAPATAQTVDIEVARFGGQVTAASAGGFTCTRTFATAGDSYQADLGYRAGSGAGAGISAAGAVDFGGSVPPLRPWLVSFGAWGQLPAGPGWSAGKAFLEPTGLPLGQVASPWSGSAGCFGLALPGGANPVLVDLDLPGGSTQVFQVDRSDGGLAVTPLDLAGLADRLGNGATVRVFGIPRADGHLQASAVLIYTGTLPQ